MSEQTTEKARGGDTLNALVGLIEAHEKAEKDLEEWFSLNFDGRLRDATSGEEVTKIHSELCELCKNELPANWPVKFALAISRFHKPNS